MTRFESLLLVAIAITSYFQWIPNGVAAIVLVVMSLNTIVRRIDRQPPILEIMAFIASLQLVLGPWLLYTFFNTHYRYHMYVPEEAYFSLATPAVAIFWLALLCKLPLGAQTVCLTGSTRMMSRAGIFLFLVGFAAGAVTPFLPPSLAFLAYLIANLRYVGAIYIFLSGTPFRWWFLAGALLPLLATSTKFGFFHEAILWASLGGSYLLIAKPQPKLVKLLFIALGLAVIFVIQAIKPQLRRQIDRDQRPALNELLATNSDVILTSDSAHRFVIRISQGWIVSAAMETVPRSVPYAKGETLVSAVEAALLPRILFPEKKKALSRINVNRFTLLQLGKKTSMGLSPLGELYVNFGRMGAIIGMCLYGLGLNSVYRLLAQFSWRDSFWAVCLPLVFLQVVKAETEFLTVLNHLVKSLVLCGGVYYGIRILGFSSRNPSPAKTSQALY